MLAVLAAVEIDPRRQRLVGYLNDDVTQRRITPVEPGPAVQSGPRALLAVGPASELRRASLLHPPAERRGLGLHDRLAHRAVVAHRRPGIRSPSCRPGWSGCPGRARAPSGWSWRPGRIGDGACRRWREALAPATLLVTPTPEGPLQWDAVVRQATLSDAAVVLELTGPFAADARDRLERADHLAWAVTSPSDLPLADLPRPGWCELAVGERRATAEEWASTLGPAVPRDYALSAEQLYQVGRATEAVGGDVPRAVRRLATGHLDESAVRIAPPGPGTTSSSIPSGSTCSQEIARRGRHRETVFGDWGFSALPSTGVIASAGRAVGHGQDPGGRDHRRRPRRRHVQDRPGQPGLASTSARRRRTSVDSSTPPRRPTSCCSSTRPTRCFGKRSEVSDAHDRYANIEVAYLLQRLERYEGIALLATNLAKNIDPAFMRRLHVVVEFPIPGPPNGGGSGPRCLPHGRPAARRSRPRRAGRPVRAGRGHDPQRRARRRLPGRRGGEPITMALAVTALAES